MLISIWTDQPSPVTDCQTSEDAPLVLSASGGDPASDAPLVISARAGDPASDAPLVLSARASDTAEDAPLVISERGRAVTPCVDGTSQTLEEDTAGGRGSDVGRLAKNRKRKVRSYRWI